VSAVQVIKVGGNELDASEFIARLATTIAGLARRGVNLILVHGGGKELTTLLTALQIETRFRDGLRVTDARTRDAALMVLSGLANKRLVAALVAHGVLAIGLSGVDGGIVCAVPLHAELGFVGRPVRVRVELLRACLAQGWLPVVAPMSLGEDGEIYNVNADHAAGAIAAAMNADLLTFVTNVPGVLDGCGALLPSLSAAQAEALIANGTISGGMIPKVRTALEALNAGVGRVRITNLDGVASNGGTVFAR